MVLRGLLSNQDLSDLLQCLTSSEPHQEPLLDEVEAHGGWPDGRRKFATVSSAIVFVLSQAESEMRLKDVHAEVDDLLGGVSFHSVTDYICKRSKPPRPLFERTRRGYYRLLR